MARRKRNHNGEDVRDMEHLNGNMRQPRTLGIGWGNAIWDMYPHHLKIHILVFLEMPLGISERRLNPQASASSSQ